MSEDATMLESFPERWEFSKAPLPISAFTKKDIVKKYSLCDN